MSAHPFVQRFPWLIDALLAFALIAQVARP